MKSGAAVALAVLLAASCRPHEDLSAFRVGPEAKGGETFDHSAWNDLLKKYVDDKGRVDYSQWKKDGTAALEAYLKDVGAAKPSKMDRPEALAFWINAYNAVTIRAVLEFYPIESIKDKVSHLPGGYNIWKDYLVEIEGKKVSLDGIEHDLLRKMDEPRIHFAINCASKGCVRLFDRAYSGEKVEGQLDEAGRAFFGDPSKFRIENGRVRISELFSWFGEDFGRTPKEQLLRVKTLLPADARKHVEGRERIEFAFLDWDWGLNER
jgi:hypothetical protein